MAFDRNLLFKVAGLLFLAAFFVMAFSYGSIQYAYPTYSEINNTIGTASSLHHVRPSIVGRPAVKPVMTSSQRRKDEEEEKEEERVDPYNDKLREKYKDIIQRLEQRQHVVEEYCQAQPEARMAKQQSQEFYHWLFTHDKLKLIACAIPKVGSTYMKRLASPGHPAEPQFGGTGRPTLGGYSPTGRLKRINSYFKVLFVRHPFHRLWSAYTSKILAARRGEFAAISQDILRMTRDDVTKRELSCRTGVTFQEFVKYLIKMYKQGNGANVHWRQYRYICHPCTMPYDFIGRMENFDEEVEVMIDKLGISKEQHESWTLTNSSLEAMAQAGCRLNRNIKCENRRDTAIKNFEYLAIEGLVDPNEDRDALIPMIEEWLFEKSSPRPHCVKKVLELLSRHPEEERTKVVSARKSKIRTEAFKALKNKQLNQLKKIYGPDFKTFGYDSELF